jgi:hypothetical protein
MATVQSWTAASVIGIGAAALVAPGVVAGGLTLLPGLDSWPQPFALRRWGIVYVVLGGLVEWRLRHDRRVGLRRAGVAALGAALVLLVAHFATVSGLDAAVETFSWSVAVVVPFVAGTPQRVEHRYAALVPLGAPIVAIRIAIEPVAFGYVVSPLVQATYLPLVGATFGLPLFALGGVAGDVT